jgi:hypothetical protein
MAKKGEVRVKATKAKAKGAKKAVTAEQLVAEANS